MSQTSPPVVFGGDLDDTWVAAIAAALPPGAICVPCAGDLPESWPEQSERASVLVLHRHHLTAVDSETLTRHRHEGRFPKVVLCIGPHARYHPLQKWATGLVDVVLPEAIASEIVARYVGYSPWREPTERPELTVLSDRHDFGAVLADMSRLAGYPASAVRDGSEVPPSGLVLWDVPVLEPGWPETLARLAPGRSLVVWLGFADRDLVETARRVGAAACLDSTCSPADLAYVLDRITASRRTRRSEPGHELPRSPLGVRSHSKGTPTKQTIRARPLGRPEPGI